MTEELCHIRCIECGKVLANKWNRYQDLLSQNVKIGDALTMLGLTRYCCRIRMMNPYKIPIQGSRNIDPRYTLESQQEKLTVATGPEPVLAPLETITNNQYIEAPSIGQLQQQIELPVIPSVPTLPSADTDTTATTSNIIRTYQAW